MYKDPDIIIRTLEENHAMSGETITCNHSDINISTLLRIVYLTKNHSYIEFFHIDG